MHINVVAATSAPSPSEFAFWVREELQELAPAATISLRIIPAPARRAFQCVTTDAGSEVTAAVIDRVEGMLRVFREDDDHTAEALTQPAEAQEIVTVEWLAEHADRMPHPWRVTGNFVDGNLALILHTRAEPAPVSS